MALRNYFRSRSGATAVSDLKAFPSSRSTVPGRSRGGHGALPAPYGESGSATSEVTLIQPPGLTSIGLFPPGPCTT